MKKNAILLILFTSTILLYACGGVIGNIEKYEFQNISLNQLKSAINSLYAQKPEFQHTDTTKYDLRETGYENTFQYCIIHSNNQKYILKYFFIDTSSYYPQTTQIVLISGAIYGNPLKLAKDISYFNKEKYKKLFKTVFITELQKEIQK